MLKVSLVIPAHNEADRLKVGFARLAAFLSTIDNDTLEVIIVDDGSSDATGQVASDVYGSLPHCLVVRSPDNVGKGAALRLGVSLAVGERVITCDADMSIDPAHFGAIISTLDTAALAPGSREINGVIRYTSRLRTYAGRLFSRIVQHETGITLRDTQCGCKGYQLGAARLLAMLSMVDGFAYDAEMLYLANQLHLRTTCVEVTWDDVAGSTVHVLRDSLRMLSDIHGLKSTNYQNPGVRLGLDVDVDVVDQLSRQARLTGLVLARGRDDSVLVLPRSGGVAGVTLAQRLGGELVVVGLTDLAGRELVAVANPSA